MSYNFQSKGSGYSYGLTYLKTRLTINQKGATDSHTYKRNLSIMQKKTIKPQKKKKKKQRTTKSAEKQSLKWK